MIPEKSYLIHALIALIILILIGINCLLWRKYVRVNRQNQELKTELKASAQILDLVKKQLESAQKKDSLKERKHNSKFSYNNIINDDRFIPDFIPLNSDFALSQSYKDTHKGIDLATDKDNPVFSAASGIVTACYQDKYLGNVVIINHLNQYKTLYAHLNRIDVKENDFIQKGGVLGLTGNTGFSSSPHLHFEIIFQDNPINPETIMSVPPLNVNQ